MILATCCFAVGSSLDKVALNVSTPGFYSFVNSIGATIVFTILIQLPGGTKGFNQLPSHFWKLTFFGVLFAITIGTAMIAFKNAPTSYSLAVRSLGFLLPAIIGVLFYGEKITTQKSISFILFVTGIVCMTLL